MDGPIDSGKGGRSAIGKTGPIETPVRLRSLRPGDEGLRAISDGIAGRAGYNDAAIFKPPAGDRHEEAIVAVPAISTTSRKKAG